MLTYVVLVQVCALPILTAHPHSSSSRSILTAHPHGPSSRSIITTLFPTWAPNHSWLPYQSWQALRSIALVGLDGLVVDELSVLVRRIDDQAVFYHTQGLESLAGAELT